MQITERYDVRNRLGVYGSFIEEHSRTINGTRYEFWRLSHNGRVTILVAIDNQTVHNSDRY